MVAPWIGRATGLASIAGQHTSAEFGVTYRWEALNDFTTVDVSAGNTSLSAEDFHRNVLLVLTGTLSGALDVIVPASKGLLIVQNDCGSGQAVTH